MNRDPAALLLDMTFAALDRRDESLRWLADEHCVERVQFIREAGPFIIVRSMNEEYPVDPRNLFCNPTDANVCHEMLRSNAEARCYEPIERD